LPPSSNAGSGPFGQPSLSNLLGYGGQSNSVGEDQVSSSSNTFDDNRDDSSSEDDGKDDDTSLFEPIGPRPPTPLTSSSPFQPIPAPGELNWDRVREVGNRINNPRDNC